MFHEKGNVAKTLITRVPEEIIDISISITGVKSE